MVDGCEDGVGGLEDSEVRGLAARAGAGLERRRV